jgi:3-dehydroquinate synthase
VPSGERHKTLETVRGVYDTLLAARLERRSPVIALGGGVVGDTAGFAAATYLRGVPFVQCPTSLLAMVDASVGGKVGVNVPQGKNLIGAFYQPMAVVVDPLVLQTLPPRELRCGLAECVKHGVIRDPGLFDWIEERVARIQAIDPAVMTELVARNVAIKARVVEEDEKESGVRAHLNFGHTFAHAIEATSGYGTIEHGEAVALGMAAATQLAVDLGRCDAALLARLTALLEKIGLPTRAELAATEELLAAMRLDKKVKAGRMRLVLPDRLGAVSIVEDAPEDAVRAAWESIRA